MRILQIHNSYQHLGGEDRVVELERAILEDAGHSVHTLLKTNHAIDSLKTKIDTTLNLGGNPSSFEEVTQAISSFRPDVVHAHNTFPLWTTAALKAATKVRVPVVQTLHNFRLLCANSLFLRNGKICTLCLKGNTLPAVLHRCYRGSLVGSAAVARMISKQRSESTYATHAMKLIVLSEFAKTLFVSAGFSENQIVVKPGFAMDPGPIMRGQGAVADRAQPWRWLFAGRISSEKGVSLLLDAWAEYQRHQDHQASPDELWIAGDGPLRSELEKRKVKNVRWLGLVDSNEIKGLYRGSNAVLFPTQCFENFPLSIAEAMSFGIPVIASQIGSVPELVTQDTGLLVSPDDPKAWTQAMLKLRKSAPETLQTMSQASRERFLKNYTPQDTLARLLRIYEDVCKQK